MSISQELKKIFHNLSFKSVWLPLSLLFAYLCIVAIWESTRSPHYNYEYSVLACRYGSPVKGVSNCSDEFVVKIQSHRNPFVISFPNKPEIVYDHSRSAAVSHGQSMSVEELPHSFIINGISFVMTDTELRGSGQIWPLQSREPVEVNLDEFTDRMQNNSERAKYRPTHMTTYPEALKAMYTLLDQTGESAWRDKIAEDLRQWEISHSAQHHLSAYGGMGSFNDVVICQQNGHKVTKAQEPWVNYLFNDLKSICYYLAKHSSQSSSVGKLRRSMGNYEKHLQGSRCLNCGYAEVTPQEAESYIACYLVRRGILEAFKKSALSDFVNNIVMMNLPGADEERRHVRANILKSGIKLAIREGGMGLCPNCNSDDTVVYRWEETGILSKRFKPSSDNLAMRS